MSYKNLVACAIVLVSSYSYAANKPMACKQVTSTRDKDEKVVDWKSDKSYLRTLQLRETFGQVKSFYSDHYQTQFYFTATGVPNSKGQIPLVDPNAKAVLLFGHGSGTMKSSGRNYIGNMNIAANLGLAGVAIDMPFHSKGPTSPEFYKSDYFMEWLRSIILELKKSGKPVIPVGHSFGPDVILEYITRYPKDVDRIGAWNPAGFTKELEQWYENYTTKMVFGGDVPENEAGGVWAATMSKQFHWNKGKLPDPTKINPNLLIRILSGKREEYVPAPVDPVTLLPIGDNTYDITVPLKKIFANAQIIIEPNIGHYIFDHIDANGLHVITREMMILAGLDPRDYKKIADSVRGQYDLMTPSVRLALRYAQDPLLQAWADENYGKGTVVRITTQQKDVLAKKIHEEFNYAQKKREMEIFLKILNSKQTDPEFYEENKKAIDAMNPKQFDNGLFPAYLQYITKKEQALAQRATDPVTQQAKNLNQPVASKNARSPVSARKRAESSQTKCTSRSQQPMGSQITELNGCTFESSLR